MKSKTKNRKALIPSERKFFLPRRLAGHQFVGKKCSDFNFGFTLGNAFQDVFAARVVIIITYVLYERVFK